MLESIDLKSSLCFFVSLRGNKLVAAFGPILSGVDYPSALESEHYEGRGRAFVDESQTGEKYHLRVAMRSKVLSIAPSRGMLPDSHIFSGNDDLWADHFLGDV